MATKSVDVIARVEPNVKAIENMNEDDLTKMLNSSLEEAIDGKGLPIEEAFDSIRNDII